MLPEEVTRLRERLGLSISGLARAIRVPVQEVAAWESGDRFPTRRAVEALRRLDEGGQGAKGGSERRNATVGAEKAPPPRWSSWKDPELWMLLRKLAAWPDLRRRVLKLAEEYPDPADPER